MAAFGQFLSTAKSNTASSVTGSELMSLGAFACGASTTQIAAFTSANYKYVFCPYILLSVYYFKNQVYSYDDKMHHMCEIHGSRCLEPHHGI